MKIIGELQASIETLQGVESPLDVRAYIVDDAVRDVIPGSKKGIPEQLFVCEQEEDVELALFIAPQIVATLNDDNPLQSLHAGNLENFLIALEGVSHFVYLTWRAHFGHAVSALELEVQAEVDKFVSSWQLLVQQGRPRERVGKALVHRLFKNYSLRDEVAPEESGRYHTASQAAHRYCVELVKRYSRDRNAARLTRDVRRFYRRGLSEKLRAA